MPSTVLSAMLQGLVLGAGLFLYPGPKDILMLRMAIAGHTPTGLIALGAISDAVLIAAGLAGLSALLLHLPVLRHSALWIGLAFTVGLGLRAARLAWRGAPPALVAPAAPPSSARSAWAALFVAALLNPIAWLDTVLVLGAVGAGLPLPQRVAFAFGAVLASLGWFATLVLGARSARRWIHAAVTWRVLDALVAFALFALAVGLLASLL